MSYSSTHPWLTFTLNLTRARPDIFWLKLGEIKSKCVHIAQAPLLPQEAQHLYRIYMAKGVVGTTAIEGNTLTTNDALKLIDGEQLQLPRSKDYLRVEVKNVVDASNRILNELVRDEKPLRLTPELIMSFNEQILHGTEYAPEVVPGEIRTHSVVVGTYRPPQASDCYELLRRLCDWLSEPDFSLGEGERITTGVLKAVIAHLYIAWIHPFADGNGRTARLTELAILLSVGVPAAAAHLLSNYYNETRDKYYRALNAASKDRERGAFNFIEYALIGLTEQLVEELEYIQKQQMQIVWINYIHKVFLGKKDVISDRQKQLILALAENGRYKPFGIKDIRLISPRMEETYRSKTDRTISRDLKSLSIMKLLEKKADGQYSMNIKSHLLSMLPPSIQDIPFPE